MNNHYSTLGVDRNATPDEIKRAYRKLAGQHHPDRGGDTAKFQAIEEAYRTLSDEGKRAAYDNPSPFGNQPGGFPGGFNFSFGPGGFNFNDVFEMFGQRRGPNQEFQRRTVRMSLWVSIADIAIGGRRPVSVSTPQGTQTIEIEIPLGINDGDQMQYPGLAPGGQDLVVQFRIHPDPRWARDGLNLVVEQAVSVWDLILGCELKLISVTGQELAVTVPARTQPRTMLRLRGKGLKDSRGSVGDILVRVAVRIPDSIDPELLAAIEKHRG